MRGFTAILPALVKAGVSLSLLILLFWLVASPEELSRNLLAADPLLLSLALALSLTGVAIQWRKWHELLLSIRPSTRADESLRSLLVGFSLGMVSPEKTKAEAASRGPRSRNPTGASAFKPNTTGMAAIPLGGSSIQLRTRR